MQGVGQNGTCAGRFLLHGALPKQGKGHSRHYQLFTGRHPNTLAYLDRPSQQGRPQPWPRQCDGAFLSGRSDKG